MLNKIPIPIIKASCPCGATFEASGTLYEILGKEYDKFLKAHQGCIDKRNKGIKNEKV